MKSRDNRVQKFIRSLSIYDTRATARIESNFFVGGKKNKRVVNTSVCHNANTECDYSLNDGCCHNASTCRKTANRGECLNKGSKLLLLLLFITTTFSVLAQNATESQSVNSKNLNEVVVRAQRGWFEGEKAVFVPTRNEKNTSNSPEELVEAMNLPMILKDGDVLTNLAGQPLKYFINGVPADKIDISTFWAKYAKRVEYIESPTDPTFEGGSAVINIVMTEFTAGGITKFDAYQKFPNSGSYQSSTMVKHRRMSFGTLVEGGYYRDHRSSSSQTETIRDIYYNGVYYPEIVRANQEHSWARDNNVAMTLNARYRDKKFRATHTFTYNWNQSPDNGSFSIGQWTPMLFARPTVTTSSYYNNNSYGLSGEYLGFMGKWSIGGNWKYSYGRINQNSDNTIAESNPILNATKENAHSLKANLSLQYQAAKEWYLIFSVSEEGRWHSTDYSGSQNIGLSQSNNAMQGSLRVLWAKKSSLQAFIEPGINFNAWKSGNNKTESTAAPTVKLSGYYSPTSRWSFSQQLDYFTRRPSINETADITLRESELVWLRGNSMMKNYYEWLSNTSVTWMPSNRFIAAAFLNYSSSHHMSFPTYQPATPEEGGLVKTWGNDCRSEFFNLGLQLKWRLFGGKLSLSVTPQYRRSTYQPLGLSCNEIRLNASASARLNNVRAEMWWESPGKGYMKGGYERYKQNGALCLELNYGTGDWYFSLRADDVLNNRKHWQNWYESEFYSLCRDRRLTGCTVSINISYSFGYGLKVKDDFGISSGSAASSAVVGLGGD